MPTYIIAYAYLDILHPIGPVQGAVRWLLGYSSPREFRLPDLRSMPGCILLLGFRALPLRLHAGARDVPDAVRQSDRSGANARHLPGARSSGASPCRWRGPAVAVGVSLALMEALNDIGASEFLGVQDADRVDL